MLRHRETIAWSVFTFFTIFTLHLHIYFHIFDIGNLTILWDQLILKSFSRKLQSHLFSINVDIFKKYSSIFKEDDKDDKPEVAKVDKLSMNYAGKKQDHVCPTFDPIFKGHAVYFHLQKIVNKLSLTTFQFLLAISRSWQFVWDFYFWLKKI